MKSKKVISAVVLVTVLFASCAPLGPVEPVPRVELIEISEDIMRSNYNTHYMLNLTFENIGSATAYDTMCRIYLVSDSWYEEVLEIPVGNAILGPNYLCSHSISLPMPYSQYQSVSYEVWWYDKDGNYYD